MPVATQVKRRRGTAAENNAFTGAEGEITVDLTNKTLRVHDGETLGGTAVETQRNKSTTISKESTDAQYPSAKAVVDYVSSNSGGAMPVGAIFTTPRTGTIEGAVEANGSEYNIADYDGEGSIGALLSAGSIAYVSKTEFQTQVTNTGACDSFGWNGNVGALYAWSPTPEDVPSGHPTVYTKTATPFIGETVYYRYDEAVAGTIATINNNIITVDGDAMGEFGRDSANDVAGTPDPTFLVPKLNPWHVGKSAPVVGNGMTLGLTNGTTNYGLVTLSSGQYGGETDAYGKPVGVPRGGSSSSQISAGITTDPTKSGMITDLSETTNLRVLVQLATGTTDEALETCTSVLSDVSAVKNASNFTATGKVNIIRFGIPDYAAGVTVTPPFTAPNAGLVAGYWYGNGNIAYINGSVVGATPSSNNAGSLQIPVDSGDVLTLASGASNIQLFFYPLKGVQ